VASIQSVRVGLKNQLALITSLTAYDTIPDSIMVPCAVVGMPSTIAYDFAFRSAVIKASIPVRVYAAQVLENEAQNLLDGFVATEGASSVRSAIDLDPTLGGVAHSARVTQAQAYGVYEMAGVQYLGVEFLVEVVA
jgi:hypothetical protein